MFVLCMYVCCSYKKINCLIVRGAYFNPAAVDCIEKYLHVSKNRMIMGVPDTKLKFPLALLNGVRLAVPNSEKALRDNTSAHMHSMFNKMSRLQAPRSSTVEGSFSELPSSSAWRQRTTMGASVGVGVHVTENSIGTGNGSFGNILSADSCPQDAMQNRIDQLVERDGDIEDSGVRVTEHGTSRIQGTGTGTEVFSENEESCYAVDTSIMPVPDQELKPQRFSLHIDT